MKSEFNSEPSHNIRSEEVHEIINRIPNWIIRSGISMIFFIFLSFLLLSYFIKYPDVVKANVVITTFPSPLTLVTRSPGHLVLMKHENDLVNKGEIIGYIESTAQYEDVLQLEQIIPTSNIPGDSLTLGSLQPYYAQFLKTKQEREDFQANNINGKQILTLKKQINNFSKLGKSLLAQRDFSAAELKLAHGKFRRDSLLFRSMVISPLDYETAQAVYIQQMRNFKIVEASITNNDIQINTLEKQVLELEAKKTEEGNSTLLEYTNSRRELMAQISKWKEMYLFVAPMGGRIALLGFWENGVFCEGGKAIFSILPSGGDIYAQAELPIAGSGKVKRGQQVNIRLENFPAEQFGLITGTVNDIPEIPSNGKYLVKIKLGKNLVSTYHKILPFKQQLKGETEIITDDINLLQRIFYQFRKLIVIKG